MLTPGETISSVIRYFVTPSQVGDRALREKCLFFLQKAGERLWTYAPWWYRLLDGSVSITGGNPLGNLPTNFAQFGDSGHVYVNGQPGRPALRFVEPPMMAALLESNTVAQQYPYAYTLWSKSPLGRNVIRVHPTTIGNVTLDVERYVGRAPYMIDCPSAFTPASGAAGNVDVGAHRWKATFLTTGGTEFTEGGIESVSLTIASSTKQVSLTDIPVSPVWSVASRNIYRTTAGGDTFKLVGSIADNITTTFTDNVADGSLGAAAPTVGEASGVGMDQFPEDWQRSLLFEYVKSSIAQVEGDVRDRAWFEDWDQEAKRAWSQLQQGRNFPKFLPRYGQKMPIGRYPSPIDRLRNA